MSAPSSIFSTELCDTHGFADEVLRKIERPAPSEPIDVPFERDRAFDLHHHTEREYLEREGDKAWRSAGWPTSTSMPERLGRQQASYWFVAATNCARLTRPAGYEGVYEIRRDVLSPVRESALTIGEASERLGSFCEATGVEAHPDAHYPFTARMLEALFGTVASLDILLEAVPRKLLPAYVNGMGWPSRDDPAFTELLRKVTDIVTTLDLTDPIDAVFAGELLARFPQRHLLSTVIDACSRVAIHKRPPGLLGALLREVDDEKEHLAWIEKSAWLVKENEVAMAMWGAIRRHGYERAPGLLGVKLQTKMTASMSWWFWPHVHTRHLVAKMLAASTHKNGARAEAWLLAEGANAIVELIGLAAGKTTKKTTALKYLALYVDRGHGDLVARLVATQSVAVQTRVASELDLASIVARSGAQPAAPGRTSNESTTVVSTDNAGPVPAGARNPTLSESTPSTSEPTTPTEAALALPSLVIWPDWIGEVRAPGDVGIWLEAIPPWWSVDRAPVPHEVENAIRSLMASGVFVKANAVGARRIVADDGLVEILALLDPERARVVVVALLEALIRDGWKAHGTWILHAFLLLPSRGAIDLVEGALRGRKGAASDPVKLVGAKMLQEIDMPEAKAALLRLTASNISNVRDLARDWLAREADREAVSPHVLSIRLTPTCGLDAAGHARFDLGRRSYTATLVDADTLTLVDPEGHAVAQLPPPRKDEDPAHVAREHRRLASIRDELALTVPFVTTTLTSAQRGGGRWLVDEWRIFLDHPVLFHLARGFLWRVDRGPRQALVVRLAEDRTLADIDDEQVPLESLGDTSLCMVSPREMVAALRSRWLELLASYQQVRAIASLQGIE